MKTTHTPGPWQVTKAGDDTLRRIQAKGEFICNAEFSHNARLIAAAPDLLAALEAMVKTFGNSTVLSDYGRGVAAQANAAIAKATSSEH